MNKQENITNDLINLLARHNPSFQEWYCVCNQVNEAFFNSVEIYAAKEEFIANEMEKISNKFFSIMEKQNCSF